jgi:hypothetical protein
MKSPRMPITQIEQRCLTASEICIRNEWRIDPFVSFHGSWRETPNLQDMQIGKVGIHLSARMIDEFYEHARNGKWKCMWKWK